MHIRRPNTGDRWRKLTGTARQADDCDRSAGTAGYPGSKLNNHRETNMRKARPWALALVSLLAACALAGALLAGQFPRQSPSGIISMDGEVFPPENPREKAEWIFARFNYGSSQGFRFGRRRFHRWGADWPKSDRQFILGVKRLTLIQARSTEHVVDTDGDDIFNYPWLYVEDPGAWRLSEAQAQKLRQYVLRGGFIMLDDSWGDREWENMAAGVHMILPGRPIEDLTESDALFHVVYPLDQLIQIPGTRYIWGWHRQFQPDEVRPRWSAVRDDKGRIVIAICHNSDVGDAWEWADSPHYPENAASEAYRIGINYIVYAMTH